MNFSWALNELKANKLLKREGWNGKNMYIYLVPGSKFTVNRLPLSRILKPGTEVDYLPHIDMRTADGKCVPWLASQLDLLAEDWDYS